MKESSQAYHEVKVKKLLAGERVITNANELDELLPLLGDKSNELASCFNRQRCGIYDQFVAWIGKGNEPADLERDPVTHKAIGTK